jgi:DNA-binding XRE family transcriptional regulator
MNNLRVARAKRRMTQWQLRVLTGINQTKLSLAENGLVELRQEEKTKIARALGDPVHEIWPQEA